MEKLIDFSDPCLRTFLPVLLQDHTTGKNIIWTTDTPPELGVGFADEITLEQLDKVQLVPRVQKRLADQKKRTSKKAEVFTPTWVCKKMADVAEKDLKSEDWKEYINKACLEVTCERIDFRLLSICCFFFSRSFSRFAAASSFAFCARFSRFFFSASVSGGLPRPRFGGVAMHQASFGGLGSGIQWVTAYGISLPTSAQFL